MTNIKRKKRTGEFLVNGKRFIASDEVQEQNIGKVLRCVSTELKDFECIYLVKKFIGYRKIEDKKTIEYIYEKYYNNAKLIKEEMGKKLDGI